MKYIKFFENIADSSGYRFEKPFIGQATDQVLACNEDDMQIVISETGKLAAEEIPPTVVLNDVSGGLDGECVVSYVVDVAHKISNAYVKDDYDNATYSLTLVNGECTANITVPTTIGGETHTFTVYYTVKEVEITGNSKQCYCQVSVNPSVVLDEIYGGDMQNGQCTIIYTVEAAESISNAYIKDDYNDETYALPLSDGTNTEYTRVSCSQGGETHTFTLYYTVNGVEIQGNSKSCYCYRCFPAGTQITINEQGDTVAIETLKSGDHVLSRNLVNGNNEIAVIDYPFETYADKTVLLTFDDNSTLRTSVGHPIYTTNGWCSTTEHIMQNGEMCNKLNIGDSIMTKDGWKILTNIEVIEERIKMYSLDVNVKYNNFYANNTLVYETPLYVRAGVDGNTLVIMENGLTKAIKDIQAGEYVIATRKSTGNLEPAIVKQVYQLNNTQKVIRITLTDNERDVTIVLLPEQCIYTINGWKSINETDCEGSLTNLLQVGDIIINDSNDALTVKAIETLEHSGYEMWEMDIDDNYDNYYISFDVINDINENGLLIDEKKKSESTSTTMEVVNSSQRPLWINGVRLHNVFIAH